MSPSTDRFPLRLLGALAIGCAAIVAAGLPSARAQDNPVRIVVPVPPGGNLDTAGRALAQRMAAITGEAHVVENRSGANTAIGTEYVARAPADGRTLLVTGTAVVLNDWMQKQNFSPLDDLKPVVQLSSVNYVLVVPDNGPASARELLGRAAAKREGLNCGAPPGPMVLACEQLRERTGGKVTSVPFPGIGPAVTALLGGHVDFMIVNVEAVEGLLQGRRLRALAASAPGLQAPLMGELWPGFLIEGFAGVFVPSRTPPEKVQQLNRLINQVLAEPRFAAQMIETGQDPVGGSVEQFNARMLDIHRRYGDLIRRLGLSVR